MLQKIRSFDIFGTPFSLDTKRGSSTYTTVIGGLLSIIAFFLFSIITYIVVSDYRDTTKPVVSVNRIRLKAPLSINLFDYEITTYIGCIQQNFVTMEQLKKYVTMRVEIVTTFKDAQGNTVEKIEPFGYNISDNLKNKEQQDLSAKQYERTSQDIGLDYKKIFGDVLINPDIGSKDPRTVSPSLRSRSS